MHAFVVLHGEARNPITREDLLDWARRQSQPVTSPLLMDPTMTGAYSRYNFTSSIPQTVFVDRTMVVRNQVLGFVEVTSGPLFIDTINDLKHE